MIDSDKQRRWWFANHPEYSNSHKGKRNTHDNDGDGGQERVSPEAVDAYVDEALKYLDGPEAELLKSVKRNFGTEAYSYEHDKLGHNRGTDTPSQHQEEPYATIGPAPPPGVTDRARYVLDIVCPGLTKAYDRWQTGFYDAYPWAPGPLYDALGDLAGLAAIGLTKIQAALAKAVNPADIAALQNARQELLKIWDLPNFPRGWAVEDYLGRTLPRTFKGIDRFENGVATSIKSMDIRLKSYQDPAKVLSKGRQYVDNLVNFDGARMGEDVIRAENMTERVLRIGVSPGATDSQKSALKSIIEYGKQNGVKVEVIRVP